MADEVTWPVEPIPDRDDVFMRAHQMHFRNGQLQPGVFRQQGNGMSVDWEKYSKPLETRDRASNPAQNAVVALNVGHVREISGLDVQHTPDHQRANRAHSDVNGLPAPNTAELVEVRIKLLRISTVVLRLGP